MKLNNGEIFSAWDALNRLTPEGTKFPVKVSLGIVKLRTKLSDSYKEIEEVRNGLVKTYGEEKDGQTIVDSKDKNYPKFVDEMNELFAQEAEVVIEKVKLPEKVAATCDACKHNMDKMLEIEPSVLMALERFVEVA
ncbi:hypothetical protein LCGC14_2823650 [marine sediment metagenome]|uniref:Uncharacterized protein n=1 Tax=marine sediment metagenome TaxID=412755 RepID=A0A0F8Z312_9ZZZZ